MPTSSSSLIQHVSNTLEHLNNLLSLASTAYKDFSDTKFSTNGALPYALRQNKISVTDLVFMGETKAKQLKWVGPKVWDEACYLFHKEHHHV